MNVAKCRRLVSLFVYCGVAVLVIVNGQSTTDDDFDKDEIGSDTVEMLREELKELKAEFRAELSTLSARNANLEKQLAHLEGTVLDMMYPLL